MKVLNRYQFASLRQINFNNAPSFSKCILSFLVLILFASATTGQELDPSLPPSGNFDLSYWKLTRPNQQEKDENILTNGYYVDGEFYTDPITGAMVFWCPNDGMTGGSSYPRNELREMMRRGDTSIGTQGINKNNWVFSSSTMATVVQSSGKYTHRMTSLAESITVNYQETQRAPFTLHMNRQPVLNNGTK